MPMPLPRLHLNHIASLDCLIAVEFGRVDDGQSAESWEVLSEDFGFLRATPEGPVIGFRVNRFSRFDPDAPEVAAIWTQARFECPMLGLADASAGEIVIAARALLDGESTLNRFYFSAAVEAHEDPEAALRLWLGCLQCGDSMAHFALGYTLYELGRHHEAYRHLRYYAQIAPAGAWNWCWLGRAAAAIGETGEARAAYERAIALEAGGEETDARELLHALESTAP